jgi:hypothetical protein
MSEAEGSGAHHEPSMEEKFDIQAEQEPVTAAARPYWLQPARRPGLSKPAAPSTQPLRLPDRTPPAAVSAAAAPTVTAEYNAPAASLSMPPLERPTDPLSNIDQILISSEDESDAEVHSAAAAAAPAASTSASQWQAAVAARIEQVGSNRSTMDKTIAEENGKKMQQVRVNTQLWADAVRAQIHCTGWDGQPGDTPQQTATRHHDPACRFRSAATPFTPADWQASGLLNFAHWKKHARGGNNKELLWYHQRNDSRRDFINFLKKGRFLSIVCHGKESRRDLRAK